MVPLRILVSLNTHDPSALVIAPSSQNIGLRTKFNFTRIKKRENKNVRGFFRFRNKKG